MKIRIIKNSWFNEGVKLSQQKKGQGPSNTNVQPTTTHPSQFSNLVSQSMVSTFYKKKLFLFYFYLF